MHSPAELERTLEEIDGTGYGTYDELEGSYGVDGFVEADELLSVAPYDPGEYGAPRRFEVVMALNRLRTLECGRAGED